MKKDLRMLGELRKGPLAGMDEDEFKMIEADVKKFGFKGLSGYAKSMVMEGMRRLGNTINKAVAERKAELEKHGDHDQSSHGAWSTGTGGESGNSSSKDGGSVHNGVKVKSMNPNELTGGSKVGEITTTPRQLDKIFGKGTINKGDEFERKVTEEWAAKVTGADGKEREVSVYDWMRYDKEGLSQKQGFSLKPLGRDESFTFSIGGLDSSDADIVRQALQGANKNAFNKAKNISVGDKVTWNSSGGSAEGKVLRIERSGKINVPDSSFEIEGTEDDPAALIVLYRDGKPTETKVGHKVSTLKKK